MSNRIEITDFTAPELDVYARIPEVQLLRFYEPKPGLFIAESPKVIQRAANAGYQPVSFLVQHKDLEKEGKELLQKFPGIPVYTAVCCIRHEQHPSQYLSYPGNNTVRQ